MIEIVTATLNDLDAASQIFYQVGVFHEKSMVFKKRTIDDDRKMVKEIISSKYDEDIMYLAQEKGITKGYCIITLKEKPSCYINNKAAFIESMGVDEEYQREGVGEKLMQAAKEWGRDRKATKLEINVYTFNEGAIRFYEKNGLKTFSQRMDMEIGDKE